MSEVPSSGWSSHEVPILESDGASIDVKVRRARRRDLNLLPTHREISKGYDDPGEKTKRRLEKGHNDTWLKYVQNRAPEVPTGIDALFDALSEAGVTVDSESKQSPETGRPVYECTAPSKFDEKSPLVGICDTVTIPLLFQEMADTPGGFTSLLQSASRNPFLYFDGVPGSGVFSMDVPKDVVVSVRAVDYLHENYAGLIANAGETFKTVTLLAGLDPDLTIIEGQGYVADIRTTAEVRRAAEKEASQTLHYDEGVPEFLNVYSLKDLRRMECHNQFLRIDPREDGLHVSLDSYASVRAGNHITEAYLNMLGLNPDVHGGDEIGRETIFNVAGLGDVNIDVLRSGETAVLRFNPRDSMALGFVEDYKTAHPTE